MTIVEIIVEVMPLALSVIAFVMSLIARNKKMATKSLQQIESEAQTLKQKYIEKQCKKNKVEQTTDENKNIML